MQSRRRAEWAGTVSHCGNPASDCAEIHIDNSTKPLDVSVAQIHMKKKKKKKTEEPAEILFGRELIKKTDRVGASCCVFLIKLRVQMHHRDQLTIEHV